mmetsp:Transcript_19730/g.27735  ORF Transcript_19730/g.27735 Transcript_19730/m.27735 type:complete len:112 (+) Transcript_19730:205-540(+)
MACEQSHPMMERNEFTKQSTYKKNTYFDEFRPRPSKKIRRKAEHDDDVWLEMKVVRRKNSSKNKTKKDIPATRSLFYSLNTGIAHWDEAPTGASRIMYCCRSHFPFETQHP